jgi:hypothetical protein
MIINLFITGKLPLCPKIMAFQTKNLQGKHKTSETATMATPLYI